MHAISINTLVNGKMVKHKMGEHFAPAMNPHAGWFGNLLPTKESIRINYGPVSSYFFFLHLLQSDFIIVRKTLHFPRL